MIFPNYTSIPNVIVEKMGEFSDTQLRVLIAIFYLWSTYQHNSDGDIDLNKIAKVANLRVNKLLDTVYQLCQMGLVTVGGKYLRINFAKEKKPEKIKIQCSDYEERVYEYQKKKKSLHKKLFSEKPHLCVSCGSVENLTIDHIIPLRRGGTNDLSNLQIMCLDCNRRKKDKIQCQ